MKPSLAVISERWVDANPNLPISTNDGNVYKTAIASDLFSKVDHLFVDKHVFETGQHIDESLAKTNYDIYFISFLGSSPLNPTAKSLSKLPGKIVFNWPDTVWPWIDGVLAQTNPYASLQLAHDWPSERVQSLVAPKKIHTIGTPQDPNLFYYKDQKDKTIDVCFMGYQYGSRKEFINYLKTNFKGSSYFGTGSREEKLSYDTYSQIMRDSKICVNFSMSPSGTYQLKGRVFEALACNCLLLEQKNPETCKSFLPDLDYQEFSTPEELLHLINWHLTNSRAMDFMADKGNNYYYKHYSSKSYWTKILELLNEK